MLRLPSAGEEGGQLRHARAEPDQLWQDRKYDPDEAKDAFTKIYNSQAVFACSNMPRFGANKVLTEQQIKDLVAFLFDPESPVNK